MLSNIKDKHDIIEHIHYFDLIGIAIFQPIS